MNMKPGDLVRFITHPLARSHPLSDRTGVLIKRTYLTYDPNYCRWDVLFKGRVTNVRQRQISPVQ